MSVTDTGVSNGGPSAAQDPAARAQVALRDALLRLAQEARAWNVDPMSEGLTVLHGPLHEVQKRAYGNSGGSTAAVVSAMERLVGAVLSIEPRRVELLRWAERLLDVELDLWALVGAPAERQDLAEPAHSAEPEIRPTITSARQLEDQLEAVGHLRFVRAHGVTWRHSLAGIDARGSLWGECDLKGVSFRFARLDGCRMVDTSLEEAILEGATWRGARLDRVSLRQSQACCADFSEAQVAVDVVDGADLRGARFEGARFDRPNLTTTRLEGAVFRRSLMLEANATGVSFAGGVMADSSLRGANLAGADLSGVDAYQLDLRDADLSGANLRELRGVGLDGRGACFAGANLEGADFSGAMLDAADVSGVRARRARFVRAHLVGANLEGTALAEARFDHADLAHASFRQCALHRASLDGASLHRTNLDGVDLVTTSQRDVRHTDAGRVAAEDFSP
ncbi:MAG: pentapeptide repeat-containing protein [Myxococcota bacterium]